MGPTVAVNPRDAALKAATMVATKKNAEAIARGRKRLARTRPWRSLEETWRESHFQRFGKDSKPEKWGAAELSLAKKYVSEVGLEAAERTVKLYLGGWRKEGVPGFRLFWVEGRPSTMIAGRDHDTKADVLARGEYDKEGARDVPKSGW